MFKTGEYWIGIQTDYLELDLYFFTFDTDIILVLIIKERCPKQNRRKSVTRIRTKGPVKWQPVVENDRHCLFGVLFYFHRDFMGICREYL